MHLHKPSPRDNGERSKQLLEVHNRERVEARTQSTTGGANPEMEAVGMIHETKVNGG